MAPPTSNERQPLLQPNRNAFPQIEQVPSTIQIDPAILARAIQIATAEIATSSSAPLQGASHPASNTIPIDPAALARSMQIGGEPTLSFPDGRYLGEVKNGVPHGKGTMIYNKGHKFKKYDGEWKNGEFHGQGVLEYSDGDRYEGSFAKGKCHGKGSSRWANGDTYVGEWQNDKFHGKGIRKSEEGHSYDGDWENCQPNGKGKYTWPSGQCYEGQMRNNKRNGYGKDTLINGDYYEGEWVDNVKQGRGKWVYNYHVYEGIFKDGKFWSGTWSGGNTTPNKGTFENGKSLYEKGCCTIL